MITLNNISLQRGSKLLFQAVTLSFFEKQKVGVVGKNGSGKTSLFSMLLNELKPDVGDVFLSSKKKIVSVDQEIPISDRTALDYVLDADQKLRILQNELQNAEINQDGQRIAAIYIQLENIDGFSAEARAAKILDGLGFLQTQIFQPVNVLSGGWRVRLNMARALFVASDILLLDEPTNHLDLDAVIWLERWLAQYQGLLLLISHDREFLDNVVSHIALIENKSISLYMGNYSAFEKQYAESLLQRQKSYEKQQEQIVHIQSYIDRFRAKATKARQVQSRIKALEKMQKIMPAHIDSPFSFEFREPASLPSPLLKMEDISFGYHENRIFENLYFRIENGDRIGLLGANGAGKTTLMKIMASQLQPNMGLMECHRDLKIGYFAQYSLELLELSRSAMAHLQLIAPQEKESTLRRFLGGFNFSGDMALMPITNFSGGEKARLALALIIWKRPNLLLLDEPTNHLDLDMRQALVIALQNYSGSLVLVSHDRFLLRNVVDVFYLVAHRKLELFKGDLDDYQKWLLQNKLTQIPVNEVKEEKVNRRKERAIEAASRNQKISLKKQIQKLEESISYTQLKLQKLDELLSDGETLLDINKDNLKDLLIQRSQMNKEINEQEQLWFLLHEQLENLKN